MNPVAFKALETFLETQTNGSGPYALPPNGVRWTTIPPVSSMQEALARAVKEAGHHVGVLMPVNDVVVQAVRGPYKAGQAGGAIREVSFYATVFIRSMKSWVLDGAFLWLTDWFEELFRGYTDPHHVLNDTLRIGPVALLGAFSDYLVVEARCSLRYVSQNQAMVGPALQRVSFAEGITVQDFDLRQHWFTAYLTEGGP